MDTEMAACTICEQPIDGNERIKALDTLCGEILHCLKTNLLRGHLTTENDADFDRMIEGWTKRRSEI